MVLANWEADEVWASHEKSPGGFSQIGRNCHRGERCLAPTGCKRFSLAAWWINRSPNCARGTQWDGAAALSPPAPVDCIADDPPGGFRGMNHYGVVPPQRS